MHPVSYNISSHNMAALVVSAVRLAVYYRVLQYIHSPDACTTPPQGIQSVSQSASQIENTRQSKTHR